MKKVEKSSAELMFAFAVSWRAERLNPDAFHQRPLASISGFSDCED